MRQDDIRNAIANLSGDRFESFARQLATRALYPGLVPTSQSHDQGRDAKTESTTVFLNNGQWLAFGASKTDELTKIVDDCTVCRAAGHIIDVFVFVTSGDRRETTISDWKTAIKQQFGWDLVVHGMPWLTETAAKPEFESLVDDYLDVPPPDQDWTQQIIEGIKAETIRARQNVSLEIPGIGLVERAEIEEAEAALKDKRLVLITGEAGTGKSGIGALLADNCNVDGGKTALLLDAKRIASTQSQSDSSLRELLGIRSSAAACLNRVAKHGGCRLIIDQIDNVFRLPAAEVLLNLVRDCMQYGSIEIVLIARSNSTLTQDLLTRLQSLSPVVIESKPIDDQTTLKLLEALGFVSPAGEIAELARNLLNLWIIATVKSESPGFDGSSITDETALWNRYRETIVQRENVYFGSSRGEEVVREIVRLAKEALLSDDRTVVLASPVSDIQERLLSGMLIVCTQGRRARFKHQKLQEFFYAWDATEQGLKLTTVIEELRPEGAASDYLPFRLAGVLAWMAELYRRQDPTTHESLLRACVLSPKDSELPFYVRANVLGCYIHLTDPGADPRLVRVILEVLATKPDLRRHFFDQRPNPVWAGIFWNEGLITTPPPPITDDRGTFLAPWDFQQFLVSVAKEAPDVVLAHVNALHGDAWYQSRAMQALCELPATQSERAISVITGWFKDLRRGQTLSWQAIPLMDRYVSERRTDLALPLFEKLTQPWLLPDAVEEDKMSRHLHGLELPSRVLAHEPAERHSFRKLARLEPLRVADVLERNLRAALGMLNELPGDPDAYLGSYWRSAIEDSDQDRHEDARGQILTGLRDALEIGLELCRSDTLVVLERYLGEKATILRRLGIYMLSRHSEALQELVSRELLSPANLHDRTIHHEYSLLMISGFRYLSEPNKIAILNSIRSGPPDDEIQEVGRHMSVSGEIEPSTYQEAYKRSWIRDRLWLIRDYLEGPDREFLAALTSEHGEPLHPEFTRYMSIGSWVRDLSPLSEDQISQLTPEDLATYLSTWHPPQDSATFPDRASYSGLGFAIASVIDDSPDRYRFVLASILRLRPEYASAVLNRFTDDQRTKDIPWEVLLSCANELLGFPEVASDVLIDGESSWTEVRKAIARLCNRGLVDEHKPVPTSMLGHIRSILLQLIRDTDPDPEREESWPDGDALTASLNHVRPIALEGLIFLARAEAKLSADDGQTDAVIRARRPPLAPVLVDQFSGLLDLRSERSLAVRSVFGRYFTWLDWLDKSWTRTNIDRIFTQPTSPENVAYFSAAFDSFVISSRFTIDLAPVMSETYRWATMLVTAGYSPKVHIDPVPKLAMHLIWMYLLVDEHDSGGVGRSLIEVLYSAENPKVHADIARAIVNACRGPKDKVPQFWPRLRLLLEDRVRAASRENHSSSYDEEMRELAKIFPEISSLETIDMLWPLLECMPTHVSRGKYLDHGWVALEMYLEAMAKPAPRRVIEFYQLMIDANEHRNWHEYEGRARRIFEICIADKDAKEVVCSVLDTLSKRGIKAYDDLFRQCV